MKFYIVGDKKVLFESRKMKAVDSPQKADVSLEDIKRLCLLVIGKQLEHSSIPGCRANAKFEMNGNQIPLQKPNSDE